VLGARRVDRIQTSARAVAFAISQPEDVDVNEILFRPTRQEL
jgi:NADP-dependent 3-hydroxy acid dehydrogenase YdfG